jgi:lactose/L-arabinose transport system permease protein
MRHPIRLEKKYEWWGWFFVTPASVFIFVLAFYPMVYAFIISLQSGLGTNLRFTGLRNYFRLFQDPIFPKAVANVFMYLLIQVPVMIFLALILASVLNNKNLKFKGFFRTLVFLPCATALVSSALIFKSFFSLDGIVNFFLLKFHFTDTPISFLMHPYWAKFIIILVITWRWTGYNTIFYLAGLQNIDTSVYEAASIDGTSPVQQFFQITLPLLRPVILLTTVMATNGTLQLFDEVKSITTDGGPGTATLTISFYIYDLLFTNVTQFGYAATVSYSILIMVTILTLIQLKVGDRVS